MTRYFETNSDIDMEDFKMLHPNLTVLFIASINFCQTYKLPCNITSLISDRGDIVATSRTHEEGRAFDMSTAGWSVFYCRKFEHYMNKKFKAQAAISSSDNKPRAVVYGDKKHLDHMHVQVRRELVMNEKAK